MKVIYRFLLLASAVFVSTTTKAQELPTTDFYDAIKKYDLSKLFHADSIQTDGEDEKIPLPEPLGFIGDNFQRFYIHYLSVTKSATNPYVYDVRGKTRVKDNICDFTGIITIITAKLEDNPDYTPKYKPGNVTCRVLFYEDSTQSGAGTIKGTLTSHFFFDKKGSLTYDALMFSADGFSNNRCEATWTSYKTGRGKKCNWGDYRIPDSGELDGGAGEFIPSDKYLPNGWESYRKSYLSSQDAESQKARSIEKRAWWN